jgi:hypothetical protein
VQKLCTKCKQLKSLDNFTKNRTQKDGLDYVCKSCHRIYERRPERKKEQNNYSKHSNTD